MTSQHEAAGGCKPAKKTVLQNLLNFSDSSDDEHATLDNLFPVPGKSVNKTHADFRKEKTSRSPSACKSSATGTENKRISVNSQIGNKRKTVKKDVVQSARKINASFKGKMLSELGIMFDWSESSDEGELKIEKEIIHQSGNRNILSLQSKKEELTYNTKDLQCNTYNKDLQTSQPTSFVQNQGRTKQLHVATKSKIQCRQSTQPLDYFGARPVSASPRAEVSVKDLNTKERDILKTKNETKLAVDMLKSKPFAENCDGKAPVQVSSKSQVFSPFPNMTVIRSAHSAGSFLDDSSPSQYCLLPLSESTRLDSFENNMLPKQKIDNLLASDNSPELFKSSLVQSEDSSFENYKVMFPKTGSVVQTQVTVTRMQSERGEGEKLAKEVKEKSETESEYSTCIATPDVSSMYEAIDVSVQTSIKTEDTYSPVTKDFDTIGSQNFVDRLNPTSSDAQEKFAKTECGERIEINEHCQYERPLLSCIDGKNKLQASTDTTDPRNTGLRSGQEKIDNQDQQVLSATAEGSSLSQNSLPACHHQPRTKHPSDSNYFSENSSDLGSYDCVGDSLHSDASPSVLSGSKKNEKTESDHWLQSKKEDKAVLESKEFDASRLTDECTFGETAASSNMNRSDQWGQSEGNGMPRRNATKTLNSSDDDDDQLEAFFQKMRASAKPKPERTKSETVPDLKDFIVSSSDTSSSDEDACPLGVRWSEDKDTFLEETGMDSGQSLYATATDSNNSNSQATCSSADDGNDDCGDGLSTPIRSIMPALDQTAAKDAYFTPHILKTVMMKYNPEHVERAFDSKTKPRAVRMGHKSFSSMKTSRSWDHLQHNRTVCQWIMVQGSAMKWYTPATSLKPRARQYVNNDRKTSLPATECVVKGDNYSAWRTPAQSANRSSKCSVRPHSFMRSLCAEIPDHLKDAVARSYISQFKARRAELSSQLFKLFNFTVFENQLPSDMPVEWNKRLLKTAGRCQTKRCGDEFSAAIDLSTKVCDTAERVRDTLIHEMCHAAVWMINKVSEGHGRHWRYWSAKANRAYPEIPIIKRCHNYEINTKYIYKCTKCGYQVGRHSKSIDTEKKVCGRCHGKFQILFCPDGKSVSSTSLSATPRTLNPFAVYVKENYSSVKKQGDNLAHKEVMQELSREFAKTKLTFT